MRSLIAALVVLVSLVPSVVVRTAYAADPPPVTAEPPAPTITLRHPIDCKPRKARADRRIFYDCAGEERARVALTPTATLEPLGPADAASDAATTPIVVPSELVAVYRTCPYEPIPALDALPDRFIAYEDRDVGRCYLWAPLDRAALKLLDRFDRHDHLATIHPYMRAVMLRALAETAAAGYRFRVISGARPGGKPSWHTFGLAVDVNLSHRKGLKEATQAYLAGGDERAAWLALAAVGERLGLYWLGKDDPDEIFHFEWRPGWTGLPHGDVATDLTAEAEAHGSAGVWARLDYDPTRKTAMAALRDPWVEPAPRPE